MNEPAGCSWRAGALSGCSVIVTGGGTGLGAACAERLARDGADVVISGRTESRLIDAAARINESVAGEPAGGRVRHLAGDVTDEGAVRDLVALAVGDAGVLHGVVANAGGGGGALPYHLQDVDEFTRVLHLNALGTMLLVKHTVAPMVAAGGGSFVGMSSISGGMTKRYGGAYGPAKAAVEQIVRNAADEYGEVNVRFNAVRPGFISTEIMEGIPREGEVFASYVDNTPMGAVGDGVGEPADVADLVRFLIGPESRWVTGTIIAVDGGHSLRKGPDYTPFVEPVLGRDVLLARAPLATREARA
jgi:NAD(P)-dependent dehydrogenase (short-subunit alcohol dehydrogenase family)